MGPDLELRANWKDVRNIALHHSAHCINVIRIDLFNLVITTCINARE